MVNMRDRLTSLHLTRFKPKKMKTGLFTLAGLTAFTFLSAQDNQALLQGGTITYEEKTKLEIKLDGDAAQFAHMLPKERQALKILLYTKDNALYKKDDTGAEEDIALQSGGAMVNFRMSEPDNMMFTDMKNRVQIEQREFMSRMFLIESDMTLSPWKLTGNEREILGFPCQEAVMEQDSVKTIAWFTPAIPLPIGPASYNNLPGVVLAVDINDGRRTITATGIKPDQPKKIDKPKSGKKVTEAEFKKIVDEKMKEMGVEQGGAVHGERVMIRISR